MSRATISLCTAFVTITVLAPPYASGQLISKAFTYQGRLDDNGSPANTPHDFEFRLYNGLNGIVAGPLEIQDVPVNNGLFSVVVDFNKDVYTGESRYLEIRVRPGASTGSYTLLSPKQELTPTPYAIYALEAGTASSVDWGDILGIPLDLSNGDDDTTYSAGSGLSLSGTTFSIQAQGVVTSHIADKAVTATKIADNTITALQIGSGAVRSSEIGDGTITSNDMDANSVMTFSIANGAVTNSKIANNAITNSKIASSAVNADQISDEPGVASYATSAGFLLDTLDTTTTIASRSITAPDSGFVLVIASASAAVAWTPGNDIFSRFGVSDEAGTFPSNQSLGSFFGGSQISQNAINATRIITVHGLFSVSSGSHTFYFLGRIFNGSPDISISGIQLTLIYFPTSYGGVNPTILGNGEVIETPSPRKLALPRATIEKPAATADPQATSYLQQIADLTARLERLEARLENQPDTP